MKFRRFSHPLLPFAHLKCLCVAARYFVKKYVRFFQMHFQLWRFFCSSQDKNVACDCFIFHKAFWKTFPSQQENFLFMKNNIEHSGRQSLPHSGRSIIRTIYEAQHRRLPACSRKYWELFMKNNIDCFLCDVPNMSLPPQSVSVVDFIHNSLSGEKYFEIAKLKIFAKKLIIETSSNKTKTKRKRHVCYFLHAHVGSRGVLVDQTTD